MEAYENEVIKMGVKLLKKKQIITEWEIGKKQVPAGFNRRINSSSRIPIGWKCANRSTLLKDC